MDGLYCVLHIVYLLYLFSIRIESFVICMTERLDIRQNMLSGRCQYDPQLNI